MAIMVTTEISGWIILGAVAAALYVALGFKLIIDRDWDPLWLPIFICLPALTLAVWMVW